MNELIDPQMFDLEFAPGTVISDRRNNTSYVIGKDQKPVGEVVPIETPIRQKEAQPTYGEERGWGWPWLIAGVAAIALLCGGGWWFIRRKRIADQVSA